MARLTNICVHPVSFLDPLYPVQEIDEDGNGEVDTDELPRLFASLGWDNSPEIVSHALTFLDADNNGTIDLDEFMELASEWVLVCVCVWGGASVGKGVDYRR